MHIFKINVPIRSSDHPRTELDEQCALFCSAVYHVPEPRWSGRAYVATLVLVALVRSLPSAQSSCFFLRYGVLKCTSDMNLAFLFGQWYSKVHTCILCAPQCTFLLQIVDNAFWYTLIIFVHSGTLKILKWAYLSNQSSVLNETKITLYNRPWLINRAILFIYTTHSQKF